MTLQADVLTVNYDQYRTNATLQEKVLHTGNVNPAQFGRLFTRPVDGFLYAQPLYQHGVEIAGQGTHNVVYVATMHNTVYAFDADNPAASDPLWQINLGPAVRTTVFFQTDIVPELGILGTPVIDAATRTMYVVACTSENNQNVYRLHALDVTNGHEKSNSKIIAARVPGAGEGGDGANITFDANQHLQRPGLLLANGRLYIAFGSYADTDPYHGWLMAYDAQSLQQMAVLNTTPNGNAGSVWQGGRGPAVDDQGLVYISTGNGDFDGETNFGQSILRLNPNDLSLADFFTPSSWTDMNTEDADLGSCGPLLIPGTDLLTDGGKSAVLYLMHRGKLGRVENGDDAAVQSFTVNNFGVFNLALWNRADGPLLYTRAAADNVKAFRLQGGLFGTDPVSHGDVSSPYAYDGLALSADGDKAGTGILWVTTAQSPDQPAPGVLHALNASDLSQELWNSALQPARDALGPFAKFATPTVADGKVFVPTFGNQLVVYGLLPRAQKGISAVVGAGSGQGGAVTGGELLTVKGSGFGVIEPVSAGLDNEGVLPTSLAGVQVEFDGTAAPLLYASDNQVNVIVPNGVANQTTTEMRLLLDRRVLDQRTLAVGLAPGLFTANATGSGPAAALNQDGSVNSLSNPAEKGSVVVLYLTGVGPTDPPSPDGHVLAQPAQKVRQPITVLVDGQPSEVLYFGPAPGLVAGVMQLNIMLPDTTPSADAILVTVKVGGGVSQTNAYVSVQ